MFGGPSSALVPLRSWPRLLQASASNRILAQAFLEEEVDGRGRWKRRREGGGGGSCAVDVPCNLKYVDIFGFISIPVMASTGFLTIFLALLYYDLSRKEIVE